MCSFWDAETGLLLIQLTLCVIFPLLKKVIAALPPEVETVSVERCADATLLHPHPLCQWSSTVSVELSSVEGTAQSVCVLHTHYSTSPFCVGSPA